MSLKSKYIVGGRRVDGRLEIAAFIFPESTIHAEVAMRMFGNTKAVFGAGFVELTYDTSEQHIFPHARGESTSLNVHSRTEDEEYLAVALGLLDKVSRRTLIGDRDEFIARGLARNEEGIQLLGVELNNCGTQQLRGG